MRLPGVRFTEDLMRLARDRRYSYLACLLASTILAEVPYQGTQSSREMPTQTLWQAVGAEDYQILDVALLDVIDFKEFTPWVDVEKKTAVVLCEKTAGSSGPLSDAQLLRGESHGKRPYLIPADIRANLRWRNSKEPVSLQAFKPSSPKVLVRDLSGLRWFDKFETKYPGTRGYFEAWLPGYSRDGETAVLRAWFGPTPHGATVTYMLAKKNGKWTVIWRKAAYYL